MKKFIVYLLVIILTVSLGFAVFYLVRDNEVISISTASIYKDAGEPFTLDVNHTNKKSYTEVNVTSSNEEIVSGSYDEKAGQYNATAHKGGVARINVRTTNSKFRNLWCDVIVGDGTVESPFYISTAEQLAAIGMGEEIDGTGVYAGAGEYSRYASNLCYKLIANIDASTINQGYWVPLQNFNGRFDGNGCTISNVYIDVDGYRTAFPDDNVQFVKNSNAGLFASLGQDSVVYNLKLENFTAVGTYSAFGTIAGINQGTIERVEVKDARVTVNSAVFGGIVGRNVSSDKKITTTDANGYTTETTERVVARLDRTSINLILGQKLTLDASGNEVTEVVGATGVIGGIIGQNEGGTLVYSYVRGSAYLGQADTYGGIVGKNICVNTLKEIDGEKYQSASIKDCYSDIKLVLSQNLTSGTIGGAIGENKDYQDGTFESADNLIVNNYLAGIYYNKDSLNLFQENITKNFKGLGKFTLDSDNKVVTFADSRTIVYGLTTEELKEYTNFVSHVTKDVQFNEDGTSQGIVNKDVMWLFDSVWVISSDTNDGMPYLNYQLVYIPDDFTTMGTPVVSSTLNEYKYMIDVDYPVSILSGTDGKIRFTVGEYYQLVYSPTGIDITWESSDTNVVTVDENGKLYGKTVGSVDITATTKSGNRAIVRVIVQDISYNINAPESITLQQGETFNLGTITASPTPTEDIVFSVVDQFNNTTDIATINGSTLKASLVKTGSGYLVVSVGGTVINIPLTITQSTDISLTVSSKHISGYIDSMSKTGSITISNDASASVNYAYTFLSGEGIVTLNISGDILNYTINSTGSASARIYVSTPGYEDAGTVDVYFTIRNSSQYVTLEASPAYVNREYSLSNNTGTISISNNAGISLLYTAESSNTDVVDIYVLGNSIDYTIYGAGCAIVEVSVTTTNYQGYCSISFNISEEQEDNQTDQKDYVWFNATTVYLNVGETYQNFGAGTWTSITLSSNDTSIATVDQQFNITGVSAGRTTVKATTSTGVTATCTVIVSAKDTTKASISISPKIVTLNIGETCTLSTSGTYSSITWKSLKTSIVTVSNKGVVTGVSSGTTRVTATASYNGTTASDSITINVLEPVEITLEYPETVAPNTEFTVKATVNTGAIVDWGYYGNVYGEPVESGNTYKITSSDDGYIMIYANVGSVSTSAKVTIVDQYVYTDGYIDSLDDLNSIRNNLDKDFILRKTITVGSWTPIEGFSGTLKSQNGAYLTGMIVSTTGTANGGLFASTTKRANINGITIKNSQITAYNAGAIVGKAENGTKISDCTIENCTIKAKYYAGGVVGALFTNSIVSDCTVNNSTISSTTVSNCGTGGIVGGASASTINDCTVKSSKISIASTTYGYAGGIVGNLYNSVVSNALVTGTSSTNVTTISANSDDSNYAGGIAGYVQDTTGSIVAITKSTVNYASISGYYAGGITGSMTSRKTVTLTFKDYKSGLRSEDLDSISSSASFATIYTTAVRENAKVSGVMVGGLAGVINSGVVTNCYTRASLNGSSSKAVVAGFASEILASSNFTNEGGTGTVGLVRYCYSACKFSGSGDKYSITSSRVHNYASFGSGSGRPGYVMDYVFDNDVDGKADYYHGSNLFASDKVQAKKSTSEMKTTSTYTDKGFDSSIWSFGNGYPTLKSERTA